ncbi:MAG: hypothetical protein Kow00108_14380 [Calditrichia bacterium]
MISRYSKYCQDVVGKILIFLILIAPSIQGQEIDVSESNLSFGFLYVNQADIKSLTITNSSEFPIIINQLRFQTGNSFRVSAPINYRLNSTEMMSVDVTALSSTEGIFSDTLMILYSSDGRDAVQKIPVDAIFLKPFYQLQSPIILPSGSNNRDYRLISVPGQPVRLYSYLKDFFGESGSDKWRAFLWHSGWNECSPNDYLTTKDGFFLIHRTSKKYLRAEGIKPVINRADTIILRKGWNIIRNGYMFPIDAEFVRLTSGRQYQLYSYQGSWNLAYRLLPWLGYAVYSEQMDTLIVEGYRARQHSFHAVTQNWLVGSIVVRSGGGVDSCLYVSASELSNPFRKPPALAGGIYSAFEKNEMELSAISVSMLEGTPISIHTSSDEKVRMEIVLPEMKNESWCLEISSGEHYYFRDRLTVEFMAQSGTNVCNIFKTKDNLQDIPSDEITVSMYPNPFNSTIRINIENEIRDRLKIDILNILGQKVKTLYDGWMNPGRTVLLWNGTDNSDRGVPSGMYIAMVRSRSGVACKKIMLLK